MLTGRRPALARLAALGLVVLGAGVLLAGLRDPRGPAVLLFFPSAPSDLRGAEWRRLAPTFKSEERLRALVSEVLLGPSEIRLQRIFPVQQRAGVVILRGNRAYIDLEGQLLVRATERNYPLDTQLDYLRRNVRINFPRINQVIITIDGMPPGRLAPVLPAAKSS